MTTKNLRSKIIKGILTTALAVTVVTGFSPIAAKAAEASSRSVYPYVIKRIVDGDGVRLRASAVNGTILELMYNGETYMADIVNYNEQLAKGWIHGQRAKTGTVGYAAAQYLK